MIRYAAKYFDFGDDDAVLVITNTVPGDIVIDGGVYFSTAFVGGSPIVDVGFLLDNQGGSVDPNALGSALVATAIGQVKLDELTATTNKRCTVADQINMTLSSGSPITAGVGFAWVAILNVNPLNDNR